MDFKPRMHGFLYVRPSGSTHTAYLATEGTSLTPSARRAANFGVPVGNSAL